ncbi:DNA-binding transcriptional MerR regulator [Microbacteriaceae bacterium SG_E_30_P1]|uniref:DNA-binding transcriptional MerR regulator n=1 Tax=Antiquaquibacter oligotrophicus TaxID=2880260 RepID=A0ABT6KQY0_9MICO|nr:MerR family transcriptional regulator [Antiquaquibacter oligotrophicus]MDH6182388.1 DNA-binding transcriptional MerR regulator [Antiquaquibacter oligotrophicus]UDF14638.1 MerR family transcriptional regulator [Antiquaquibacter oligotrophicus]
MRIGEVARLSGVSARMLRHYNDIGLLTPSGRTSSGYRHYDDADLRRLLEIESLRSLGLSLAEVRSAIDDPGALSPQQIVDEVIARTRERIELDRELVRRLEAVRSTRPEEWTEVPRLVALLRGLGSSHPSSRQRAALSHGGATVAPLVDAALAEEDPNVAGALTWAMARSKGDPVPALEEALGSPLDSVRRRAVESLVKLGAIDALQRALTHVDSVVRDKSALAVGGSGGFDALPALVEMIVAGRDDVPAAEMLGLLANDEERGAEVVAAVSAALETPDASSRTRLTQALAELPPETARSLAVALAGDPDERVAITARYILRVTQPPETTQPR